MADLPLGDEEQAAQLRRRRRRMGRAVGLVVVVVAAVAFVIENSQPVKVKFWFVTAHPRLIWVVLVCLIAGALFGFLLGRERRRRRRQRRGTQRRERDD